MRLIALLAAGVAVDDDAIAPARLWSIHSWRWDAGIVVPLALFAVLYVVGAMRQRGALSRRHVYFVLGWLSLVVALDSPLHPLGEQLFSAHMLQHEILILISAPLIAASRPGATCLWALLPRHRAGVGGLMHRIEQARPVRILTAPLTAWMVEAVVLWAWHIPALYQATLTSDAVHAVQHLSFFLSALLFWSALYGVGRSAMQYGAATFYVFGTAVHCSALGALLTFSSVIWYPAYIGRTDVWGLTALQDQQLGGLLMWVPSGVVFIAVALVLFSRWLAESEKRTRLGQLQEVVDGAAKNDGRHQF
jgi:cytochrome c oxidase assembly factor CtaG